MKKVESYLRTEQGLSATDKGNIRFHVAMAVVALALATAKSTIKQVSELDLAVVVTDATISEATALVYDEFKKLGATDAIAKSADFLAKVAARLESLAATSGAQPAAALSQGGPTGPL